MMDLYQVQFHLISINSNALSCHSLQFCTASSCGYTMRNVASVSEHNELPSSRMQIRLFSGLEFNPRPATRAIVARFVWSSSCAFVVTVDVCSNIIRGYVCSSEQSTCNNSSCNFLFN